MITRRDDHLQGAGKTQNQEWLTPKISLMEAGDAEGKINYRPAESAPLSEGVS